MTVVHATLTYGPCGHTVHYTAPAQWRRLGNRYWCQLCGQPRRLVTYHESPVIWIDADPSDT